MKKEKRVNANAAPLPTKHTHTHQKTYQQTTAKETGSYTVTREHKQPTLHDQPLKVIHTKLQLLPGFLF